jgi:hypothetical protein
MSHELALFLDLLLDALALGALASLIYHSGLWIVTGRVED